MLGLGSFGAELEESDIALVVVGHPDLLPAIVVEVRESKAADSALGVVEDSVLVLELGRVAGGVKSVGCMVAISSNEDMRSLMLLVAIRPHRVGKTWSHVWHCQREGVFEISSDRVSGPIIIHRVNWELVSPDAIVFVLCLVIVDEELLLTVAVEIDQ